MSTTAANLIERLMPQTGLGPVYVMAQGRIIETGTWDTLFARETYLSRMIDAQMISSQPPRTEVTPGLGSLQAKPTANAAHGFDQLRDAIAQAQW